MKRERRSRTLTLARARASGRRGCPGPGPLDHDLGDDVVNGTGYSVVCWIEEVVATRGFVPPRMLIHSANIVGRARMEQAIASIERLRHSSPSP